MQNGAVQSGLGLSTFEISSLVNVLDKKQFEDYIHHEYRWPVSFLLLRPLLLLYYPLHRPRSIFEIALNFFLFLFSFPKSFCFCFWTFLIYSVKLLKYVALMSRHWGQHIYCVHLDEKLINLWSFNLVLSQWMFIRDVIFFSNLLF